MVDLNDTTTKAFDTDTQPTDAQSKQDDIEFLFSIATPSTFLDSIYDWWQEKGFLTKLQYQKLLEIAEREMEEPESFGRRKPNRPIDDDIDNPW